MRGAHKIVDLECLAKHLQQFIAEAPLASGLNGTVKPYVDRLKEILLLHIPQK